jgi:hypothetical protein
MELGPMGVDFVVEEEPFCVGGGAPEYVGQYLDINSSFKFL